jgi:hypothetical protein
MCRLCPRIPLLAEPQGTDSGHIAPGPAIVAAILPSTSSSHSAQRLPGATADAPEKSRPRDPTGDAGVTLLRMPVPVAARRPGLASSSQSEWGARHWQASDCSVASTDCDPRRPTMWGA